jgi:hypothetical protein
MKDSNENCCPQCLERIAADKILSKQAGRNSIWHGSMRLIVCQYHISCDLQHNFAAK